MESFSLEDAPEFELWLEGERGRWRKIFGELCERLSRLQGEADQPEGAIETARVWVRQAPLEEAAHRRLMELLSGAGESERGSAGLRGASEYFEQGAWQRALCPVAGAGHPLAGGGRGQVLFGCEPGTLGGHYAAFSTGGAACRPPRGVWCACLRVPRRPNRANARRCRPWGGRDRQNTPRLRVPPLGESREADVLEGGAAEGRGLPYGPLVEAIRPRIERERAPDDLLDDVWLSELSRLLPELKERYPDLPPSPSGEREMAKGALFEAITRLVATLATRVPVVLFLDDLEWADAATLEVLDYASKRWAEQGAPVLLLIAARLEEPEVARPSRGGSCHWEKVAREKPEPRSLADEDIEGLLGGLGKAGSLEASWRGSGGA